ncbi:outer membrane autotransporter, putative [Acidithiobacillus sp. GGI-221]|nr:outer membrane autotransporter, putative [Acidithiobacillus sp. GGI-221]
MGSDVAITMTGGPDILIFGTGSDVQGTINAGTTASTVELDGNQSLGSVAPISAPDGTLINQGTLSGKATGVAVVSTISGNTANVDVLGSLAVFQNTGVISSSSDGFADNGTVTSLVNSGSISGSIFGVGVGKNGVITSLSNAGSIAGSSYGLFNEGSIASLTNMVGETISGGKDALDNEGAITSIGNDGSIGGGTHGIYNQGDIATLTNSGLIASNDTGLFNSATFATVSNTGTISGGNGIGVENLGTITSLNNGGLIQGKTGIALLLGSGTTISNTGSIIGTGGTAITIAGGPDTVILGTGSDVQGTINAGTTASTILLEGDPVMGTSAPINDPNGSLTIAQTGNWTVSDTWSVGTVSNQGILTIAAVSGTTTAPGLLNLTGNYVQSSTGTLAMLVTPQDTTPGTDYSQLAITGSAQLNGVLDILDIGSFVQADAGNTYDLITASKGVSGTFAQVHYNPAFASYLTPVLSYDGTDVVLTLNSTVVLPTIATISTSIASFPVDIAKTNGVLVTSTGTVAGTLSNSGILPVGVANPITNSGVIQNLSNAGVINTSNGDAIVNDASLESLRNSGSISGYSVAIHNVGSAASMGTISNAGTIQATFTGIANSSGSISEFENVAGGLLSGGHLAFANDGSLGNLGNTGSIAGGSTGVYNQGSMGTLTNSGTIRGTKQYGVSDSGLLGGLSNAGLITGKTGLYLDGASTTLSNTGTLIGTGGTAIDIANSVASTLIFGTGSDVQGTINAGTTASTVELDGATLGTAAPIVLPDGALLNVGTLQSSSIGILVTPNLAAQTLAAEVLGNLDILNNQGLIQGTSPIGVKENSSVSTVSNSGQLVDTGTLGAAFSNGGASAPWSILARCWQHWAPSVPLMSRRYKTLAVSAAWSMVAWACYRARPRA